MDTSQVVFSDDMITPLASVLVNRLTGSRTIITRKMQTPPSLTYDQKLKLDDLAERLIASEEPVTLLIDGHEAKVSDFVLMRYRNAISIIDAGRPTEEVINICYKVKYLVCSKEFAETVSGITVDYSNQITLVNMYQKLKDMFKNEIIVTLESQKHDVLLNMLQFY